MLIHFLFGLTLILSYKDLYARQTVSSLCAKLIRVFSRQDLSQKNSNPDMVTIPTGFGPMSGSNSSVWQAFVPDIMYSDGLFLSKKVTSLEGEPLLFQFKWRRGKEPHRPIWKLGKIYPGFAYLYGIESTENGVNILGAKIRNKRLNLLKQMHGLDAVFNYFPVESSRLKGSVSDSLYAENFVLRRIIREQKNNYVLHDLADNHFDFFITPAPFEQFRKKVGFILDVEKISPQIKSHLDRYIHPLNSRFYSQLWEDVSTYPFDPTTWIERMNLQMLLLGDVAIEDEIEKGGMFLKNSQRLYHQYRDLDQKMKNYLQKHKLLTPEIESQIDQLARKWKLSDQNNNPSRQIIEEELKDFFELLEITLDEARNLLQSEETLFSHNLE